MNSAEPAAAPEKRRLTDRFLDTVERVGNALPDPTTLFALSALAVIVLSGIAAQFDLSVAHPTTGEVIHPVSLLSVDGLHRILTGLVTNFTSFAPLGTVLVALIGIGVAEASGLIGAVMRLLVLKSPRALLTPVVVFCGVLSNAASEVGDVLLVPLAALIFKAAGRHQVPLLLSFILLSAVINLVMGSASAKWALMAPVFIPMFMLLGYPPELIQIAYRVGDSVTNVISPMMSYFALIIAFVQRYVSRAGIGTLVSLMLPYSITFLIGWSIMFVVWLMLGWPVGPGAPTSLNISGG
jgi:p-aminobenzoyl-glutamate transporter AbgT